MAKCPVVPTPFVQKTTVSSLNSLCAFARELLGIFPWLSLCSLLCSIEYLSSLSLIPQCFDHCSFTMSWSIKVRENGNPLQCSCLENPRDGGVWWAAVYGVAQSQTQLKRLSSSSSSMHSCKAQIFTLKATSPHSSSVWYVVFVLSFGSKYFLNSTTDFFSWAMLSLKY